MRTDREDTNLRTLSCDFQAQILINGVRKMFHFENLKNHNQADARAQKLARKKNGRVLSIRKVSGKKDITEWPSGVEFMKLKPQPKGLYLGGGMYEEDVDLDKILGLRRDKKDKKNRRKNP